MSARRDYALVTQAYWAFTITDGALRMLVLLHLHALGHGALEIAAIFLLYELCGIVTNLVGGAAGQRYGLRSILFGGLSLQMAALGLLLGQAAALSIPIIVLAQGLSGVAKDLTKTSAKSWVKRLVAEDDRRGLMRWVAWLTGSKNALKGAGFFLGGLALQALDFGGALLAMMALLGVSLLLAAALLPRGSGAPTPAKKKAASPPEASSDTRSTAPSGARARTSSDAPSESPSAARSSSSAEASAGPNESSPAKAGAGPNESSPAKAGAGPNEPSSAKAGGGPNEPPSAKAGGGPNESSSTRRRLLSPDRRLNRLAAARLFLFASRDAWFAVGLPLFLAAALGWGFGAVGAFLAVWVIGYGAIQAAAPAFVGRESGGAPGARLLTAWTFTLALPLGGLIAGLTSALPAGPLLVVGLALFAIVFAANSAIHSFLVVAYAEADKVALRVGFYYAANAAGRLLGTLVSGLAYQFSGNAREGLIACLGASLALVVISGLVARRTERTAGLHAVDA